MSLRINDRRHVLHLSKKYKTFNKFFHDEEKLFFKQPHICPMAMKSSFGKEVN